MAFFCWKCNQEVPEGLRTCPHCQAPVDKQVVGQMETMLEGASTVQILPGVTIAGRYEVKKEIGRGGMGIVYLAFDRTLDRDIALKVIPHELCQDPRAIQNLKRETSIALDLTHPQIVRLHNLDTWEGQAFVTMEYVGGGTLAHFLAAKGGKLPLAEALPLLKDIAAALDYAHAQMPAVVHRDLKPLNILMTPQGRAKIADYGLARALQDSATRVSMTATAGTLAYMAPEQIRGRGIGPATDIYAFACLACEILTGEPPFTTGDLRWQIMHEEPEISPELAPETAAALRLGLQREAGQRPPSAGALVAMLAGEAPPKVTKSAAPAAAAKKKPLAVKPASSAPINAAKPPSGGRGLFFFLIFLLLAGVAGGAWWWSSQPREQSLTSGDAPAQTSSPSADQTAGLPPAGKSPAPLPKAVQPSAGALVFVSSEPAGADIYIDEGLAGKTPLNIMELSGGTHDVRLVKSLYHDFKQKVFVQKGKTMTVKAALEPEPFGDLKIISSPVGAEVWLDGKKVGETPFVKTRLPQGKRQLEIRQSCYATVKREIEIVPLKPLAIEESLEKVCGALRVASDPVGAEVYFDGKKLGRTPFSADGLPKGEHQLEVRQELYATFKEKPLIVPDKTTNVTAKLNPVAGYLTVQSDPAGAEVWLDGKKIGETPLAKKAVGNGKNKLVLKKYGYAEERHEVTIVALQESKFTGKLKALPGKVIINSQPSGATVYINNRRVGQTPLEVADLLPGKHQLKLQLGKYQEQSQTFTVAPNELKTLPLIMLEPKAGATWTEPVTGMEFVWVPGGCYQMGSPSGESNRESDEGPVHRVCVDGFWLGKYEVTQGQWQKIMGNNPANFKKGDDYPVEQVSWNDCQEYARKLGSKAGGEFRLPTEAEWEYACRAGTSTPFSFGSTISTDQANYDGNYTYGNGRKGVYRKSTVSVGSFSPNPFGLYDMHGNVSEWCQDWYDSGYYKNSPTQNPTGPSSGRSRVRRGGSWRSNPRYLRSAIRGCGDPGIRRSALGFRLLFAPGRR